MVDLTALGIKGIEARSIHAHVQAKVSRDLKVSVFEGTMGLVSFAQSAFQRINFTSYWTSPG